MTNRPSRLVVSIQAASSDGRFYGRYPHGNAPIGGLAGNAVSSVVATGTLLAAALAFSTGPTLPPATRGTPYSTTIAATGGQSPYTFTLTGATGTNSPVLSTSGVLTLTPSSAETDLLSVQVTDSSTPPNTQTGTFSLTVQSSGGQTFDYYIATAAGGGLSTNPGTLALPWDILSLNTKRATYAQKRVGLLPGTYDMSAGLAALSGNTGAILLDVQGGTALNPTYVGSSNASGQYQRGTATITGKGSNGIFGGTNGSFNAVYGNGTTSSVKGNLITDGINFTGCSGYCLMVGNNNTVSGPYPNVTFQNLEIYGNSAQTNTTVSGVNESILTTFSTQNLVFTNNYVHDNFGGSAANGGDPSHFSAIYHWATSVGTQITFNTFVNTGNVHGKEGTQSGVTVAYNYIDMSQKTPAGGYDQGIFGFNCGTGTTNPSSFHHNIIIATSYIDLTADTGQTFWNTTAAVYSNTFVQIPNADERRRLSARTKVRSARSGSRSTTTCTTTMEACSLIQPYGYLMLSADACSVLDHNSYGGSAASGAFITLPNGAGGRFSIHAEDLCRLAVRDGRRRELDELEHESVHEQRRARAAVPGDRGPRVPDRSRRRRIERRGLQHWRVGRHRHSNRK